VALNTTILAHRDAVGGGRQPSHLLPLDEGLHIGRRDQPHLVAQLADLAAPEVGAAAGFHRDNTGWQLVEERQHLRTTNLLA